MENYIEKLLILATLCEQQTLNENQKILNRRQINALKKMVEAILKDQ